MCDKFCDDCFFHSSTSNTGTNGCCDYFLITLTKRPCKSGTGCTAKMEKRNNGKFSLDERRRMWCKGNFAPT